MFSMISVTLKDKLRRMVPLYRNPVVVSPDSLHLDHPVKLPNRELAHHQIQDILKAQQGVVDAISAMDGEYVLKVVLDDSTHMLRVNVYAALQEEEDVASRDACEKPLFAAGETAEGIFTYTVVADRRKGKAVMGRLLAPIAHLVYNRWDPIASWEIELSRDQLATLGLPHLH